MTKTKTFLHFCAWMCGVWVYSGLKLCLNDFTCRFICVHWMQILCWWRDMTLALVVWLFLKFFEEAKHGVMSAIHYVNVHVEIFIYWNVMLLRLHFSIVCTVTDWLKYLLCGMFLLLVGYCLQVIWPWSHCLEFIGDLKVLQWTLEKKCVEHKFRTLLFFSSNSFAIHVLSFTSHTVLALRKLLTSVKFVLGFAVEAA